MTKQFYLETWVDTTATPNKLHRKVYLLSEFEAARTDMVKLTFEKVQELWKDEKVVFSGAAIEAGYRAGL